LKRPLPPNDRFDLQYAPEPNTGCWLWTGEITKRGYGRLMVQDGRWRHVLAHRFSYERFVGPIPDGLCIDHKCRCRSCVNPNHLQVVTYRENLLLGETLAGANAAKTHCPKGHFLSDANLLKSTSGRRKCRECNRLYLVWRNNIRGRRVSTAS